MSDQPVAKASTYTRQHKTETQRQTSMPRAGFEPTIPVTKRPNLCLRLHSHQDQHTVYYPEIFLTIKKFAVSSAMNVGCPLTPAV
jgi:hypothetical protein